MFWNHEGHGALSFPPQSPLLLFTLLLFIVAEGGFWGGCVSGGRGEERKWPKETVVSTRRNLFVLKKFVGLSACHVLCMLCV